jgi:hypothetical protein
LVIEFFTSVAVGGVAGFKTPGAATLPADVVEGGFTVIRVDVAEKAVSAKSIQVMI